MHSVFITSGDIYDPVPAPAFAGGTGARKIVLFLRVKVSHASIISGDSSRLKIY